MRGYAHRIALLALFGVWVAVAWKPLSQQYAGLEAWRARLADQSMDERRKLVDYPAYVVAQQVLTVTPPDACVFFLAYTGPEHVNYYKTRFDYYLYPRRVLIQASWDAKAEGCGYLAVFQDSPSNLREEPFRGAWDEARLRERLAGLQRVLAGPHLAVYRAKP